MGRMHKGVRGKSHSTRPISKTPPAWCKWKEEEVKKLVVELAKEGHPPSMIGLILRDQYGVPLAKVITGRKIAQILRECGLAPKIPEDLQNLINKAQNLRKHLERHRKDYSNKHALELLESKIHRLAKYYKQRGMLPPDWAYKSLIATVS